MKFGLVLLVNILPAVCDAAIPASVATVAQFNAFLEEKDIGSAQDTWMALSEMQLQAIYEDFLGTIGSTNDDGTVAYTLAKKDYHGRFEVFKQSVRRILTLTEQVSKTGSDVGPYFGITSNVDLSEERIGKRRNMFLGTPSEIHEEKQSSQALPSEDEELFALDEEFALKPEELSSTCAETKKKNPVRQQGTCGSCWAFATAEQIRYNYQRRYNQDPGVLSAQYLVDCATGPNTDGCNGGNTEVAIDWMIKNGGIPTKAAYGEYSGKKTSCKSWVKKTVMPGPSFNSQSEREAYAMFCSHGPFTISVDGDSLLHYTGGVMTNRHCSTQTNHRVLVVGMIFFERQPVWVVQNSWGPGWGVTERGTRSSGMDGGFILLQADANTCGMAREMTFLADVFSVGGRHPWTHTQPLLEWTRSWGPYPGVSLNPTTHTTRKASLALCEAFAEASGDSLLLYQPADGTCSTTSGEAVRFSSQGRGPSGTVYEIGTKPARYRRYTSGFASYFYQKNTGEAVNLALEGMPVSGALVACAASALLGMVLVFFVMRKRHSFGSRQPLLEIDA